MTRTKKIILTLALLFVGYEIHAQVRPRFEHILTEKPVDDGYHRFEVWHDKESGQEFICVYAGVDLGRSVSCFPTGRNWK